MTRKICLTAQILRLLQHLTAVLNYAGIKLCFSRIQILLISCITVLLIFLHLPAKAPKGSDFWGDDKPITPFYNSIKLTEEAPAMFNSEMVFISGCAAESRTQSQDLLNGNSEFIYNAKNNKVETVPINLESLCDDNPSSRCKQSSLTQILLHSHRNIYNVLTALSNTLHSFLDATKHNNESPPTWRDKKTDYCHLMIQC